MRNPWGKGGENTGRWSDKDPNWNYISAEEKQRIGYFDVDDGIFFMTYEDFLTEYRAITVAEINDNSSYIYKSTKDPQGKGCYFRVTILKAGLYSFQVDNKSERAFEDKVQDTYRYPKTFIEVAAYKNGQIQKKGGLQGNVRTLFQKHTLEPGTYIVNVKISFDPNFDKDGDVNLALYAEYPCKV